MYETGTYDLMDYSFHREDRVLHLHGEVDARMAELFLKGMQLLLMDNQEPITIIMNNEGGDEYHGLAIYDAIANCPSFITIFAYGHAMSMGSWIMQAADKRVMMPNCTMMLHYGTWEQFGEEPTITQVRASVKEMERINELMVDCYMVSIEASHSRKDVEKMLETETYLTADEAVAWNLADEVGGAS